jgi:hypothetical protein
MDFTPEGLGQIDHPSVSQITKDVSFPKERGDVERSCVKHFSAGFR